MKPDYKNWLRYFDREEPAHQSAIDTFERAAGFRLPREYVEFLRHSNGGEGWIGENYLQVWSVEELIEQNEDYEIKESVPDIFVFGSSGGGEAFAFDQSRPGLPIVMVPFIGMARDVAIGAGAGFNEFLSILYCYSSVFDYDEELKSGSPE